MEVPFVTRNKEVFQCSVKSVDFEDPNAACDSINQWVKNETRGEYWRVLFVHGRVVSETSLIWMEILRKDGKVALLCS